MVSNGLPDIWRILQKEPGQAGQREDMSGEKRTYGHPNLGISLTWVYRSRSNIKAMEHTVVSRALFVYI